MEDALSAGSLATASGMNSGIASTNVIEANTQLFYALYMKAKDGTYDTTAASQLLLLAKGCPERDGLVVYQARVLYNSINDEFNLFQNNCATLDNHNNEQDGDNNRKARPVVNNPITPYNTINVYPNPSDGSITIETGNELSYNLTVINILGEKVFEGTVSNKQTLNLNHLPSATYIVMIRNSSQLIKTERISIIH